VSAAAVLPEAPVIEFARGTEPHKPRKRMKARPVQKRSADERPADAEAEAPKRHEADERVWATHEGAGPAGEDPDEAALREWDPERPPRPPRPPKGAQ
jgi:hypothetical protein